MIQTISEKKSERLALAVGKGRPFTLLEGGAPRRFTKDVLHTGQWIHPGTGQELNFDRAFLERLAKDTNDWLKLGHSIWFPVGNAVSPAHNDDARLNLGFWSNFRIDGDHLFADVEVRDSEAAGKVGKTICEVSPGIQWLAVSSTGQVFDAVIEHVAATLEPVIPGQRNFIQLAREKPADEEVIDAAYGDEQLLLAKSSGLVEPSGTFKGGFDGCVTHMKDIKGLPEKRARALCAYIGRKAGKLSQEGNMEVTTLAKGSTAPASSTATAGSGDTPAAKGMSAKEFLLKSEALLGLDSGATFDQVLDAIRACVIDEQQEGDASTATIAAPAYMSRRIEMAKAAGKQEATVELSREIESLKKAEAKRRHDHAVERVALARRGGLDVGVLLDEDKAKDVVSLLESGDERLEKAGRDLLSAHETRISDAKTFMSRGGLKPATSEATQEKNEKVKASDDELTKMWLTRGKKYDPKTGKAS